MNKQMPITIKAAAVALLSSLVAALIGAYFDGIEVEELGFDDPITLVINIVWAIVIGWIIWDLYRARSIKWSLILIGGIQLTSIVWNYIEFNFSYSQLFYIIEFLMFVITYIFTSSKPSKEWFASKTTATKSSGNPRPKK